MIKLMKGDYGPFSSINKPSTLITLVGSDYGAFIQHAGIPAISMEFYSPSNGSYDGVYVDTNILFFKVF